ncbi:MAG: S-methyl-5'-thioadenosine phosphorylase, partial [Acidaminococcaceae bacterium]|nr:S-methyl-5'-thioadenosine phosphorylase [Acidaminococcaceae bacterium]
MRNIAVIGGTGVYNPEALNGFKELIITTPYGQVVCTTGMIADNKVTFITRHGAGHKTAPHKVNYRANIWALKSLGVEEIFATTAVGSLNQDMKAGHFVVCDQLIDFTKSRINTFYDTPERGVAHVDFSYPYCPVLRE